MTTHIRTKKQYSFHEKHNAWVIHRPIVSVHTTGGSWFESRHFKTEKELLDYLDQQAKGSEHDKAN